MHNIESREVALTSKPRRIAAFDLDDTIITGTTGNKWNKSATSWKWWNAATPGKLRKLHDDGYLLVVISNQGNISLKEGTKVVQKDAASLANLKSQVAAVFRQLDIPFSIYAATMQDNYRKPRTGMWQAMLEDYDLDGEEKVDLKESFYVGDAAGRAKTDSRRKDHACSDR